jgi:hypothetical protein
VVGNLEEGEQCGWSELPPLYLYLILSASWDTYDVWRSRLMVNEV